MKREETEGNEEKKERRKGRKKRWKEERKGRGEGRRTRVRKGREGRTRTELQDIIQHGLVCHLTSYFD